MCTVLIIEVLFRPGEMERLEEIQRSYQHEQGEGGYAFKRKEIPLERSQGGKLVGLIECKIDGDGNRSESRVASQCDEARMLTLHFLECDLHHKVKRIKDPRKEYQNHCMGEEERKSRSVSSNKINDGRWNLSL